MSETKPLVSVVTPVYNNREHLGECIESVLAQSYTHWDYTIVNNCCTDGSAELAREYAARDPRIRVVDNEKLLRAVPNHNVALRQISPESKYCKIVFADDWIFPNCLDEMVRVAERHPTVGIVGAYGLQDSEVMWTGLPYPSEITSGRQVCRRLLLEGTYVFGTSTSLLYRSDLVRRQYAFYNEANLHADMESCLVALKQCDFGFVHQVLTYKRCRQDSLGTLTEVLQTLKAAHLHNLVCHGPDFLSPQEMRRSLRRIVSDYYTFLAVSLLLGRRDREFWDYHRRKLRESGVGFSRTRLVTAGAARICRAVLSPLETIQKLREVKSGTGAACAPAEVKETRRNCPPTKAMRSTHSTGIA